MTLNYYLCPLYTRETLLQMKQLFFVFQNTKQTAKLFNYNCNYYPAVMFGYFYTMSPVSSSTPILAMLELDKKTRCVKIIISHLVSKHWASSHYVYLCEKINLRERNLYSLKLAFARWELCVATDKLWKSTSMVWVNMPGGWYTLLGIFLALCPYSMQWRGEVKVPVLAGKKTNKQTKKVYPSLSK